MKIIVAPDSFKGSLTALQAAIAIEKGIKRAAFTYKEPVEVINIPMADGGEERLKQLLVPSWRV